MASATKTTKVTGFQVVCPYCSDEDAILSIDLNELTCSCSSCDTTFTAEQARQKAEEQLRRWETVVRWVGMVGELTAE
jgi:transposase-like protein